MSVWGMISRGEPSPRKEALLHLQSATFAGSKLIINTSIPGNGAIRVDEGDRQWKLLHGHQVSPMKGTSVTPCTARSGSGSGGNKTFPHPPILPNESSAWCPFGWTPPPRSDGKAELPRWPAGRANAGGLEASGTYPSIVPHDEQHPPTDERLEALATAQFGPKGKKEAAAQKNEDAKVEAQAALSIHVRHSLPTIVRLGRRSPVWFGAGAAREAAADAGEGRSAGPAAQAQARAQVRATALPHTTHRRGPTTDQGVPAAAEAAGGGGWGGGREREGREEPGVGER